MDSVAQSQSIRFLTEGFWVQVPAGSLEVNVLGWLRGEGGGLQIHSARCAARVRVPLRAFCRDALVAQLAERLFRKQEVRGSRPRLGFIDDVPVVQRQNAAPPALRLRVQIPPGTFREALVAQLGDAAVSKTVGCRFESCREHMLLRSCFARWRRRSWRRRRWPRPTRVVARLRGTEFGAAALWQSE